MTEIVKEVVTTLGFMAAGFAGSGVYTVLRNVFVALTGNSKGAGYAFQTVFGTVLFFSVPQLFALLSYGEAKGWYFVALLFGVFIFVKTLNPRLTKYSFEYIMKKRKRESKQKERRRSI